MPYAIFVASPSMVSHRLFMSIITKDELVIEYDVKPDLARVVDAVYKGRIPEPDPVVVKEDACNQYYAALILRARGKHPTARNIHDLVKGNYNQTARALKLVKSVLPGKKSDEKPDKKEVLIAGYNNLVREEVEAEYFVELEHQDSFHTQRYLDLEESSSKRIAELERALAVESARADASGLAVKQGILQAEGLTKQLISQTKLESQIHSLTERCEDLKQQNDMKDRLIEQLRESHELLAKSIGAELQTQIAINDRLESSEAKLTKNVVEIQAQNKSLMESLADAELELNQRALKLKHQHEISEVVGLVKQALEPLGKVDQFIDPLRKITNVGGPTIEKVLESQSDVESALNKLVDKIKAITVSRGK